MKVVVLYGTNTGYSQGVAEKIGKGFYGAIVEDISKYDINDLDDFDLIILGSSTFGFGDLCDDWEDKIEELGNLELDGKKIGLFATGDQYGYSDSFVGAMAHLYEKANSTGATVIGFTSTDGYEHDDSEAEIDGKFVGLAIDEDNQSELTDSRIEKWIAQLKTEI